MGCEKLSSLVESALSEGCFLLLEQDNVTTVTNHTKLQRLLPAAGRWGWAHGRQENPALRLPACSTLPAPFTWSGQGQGRLLGKNEDRGWADLEGGGSIGPNLEKNLITVYLNNLLMLGTLQGPRHGGRKDKDS